MALARREKNGRKQRVNTPDRGTPERLAKPKELWMDPIKLLVERGEIGPGEERACEHFDTLRRMVIGGTSPFPRGTLDESGASWESYPGDWEISGRERRYRALLMEEFLDACYVVRKHYDSFWSVVVLCRWPSDSERPKFVEMARNLASHWKCGTFRRGAAD